MYVYIYRWKLGVSKIFFLNKLIVLKQHQGIVVTLQVGRGIVHYRCCK